MKEMKTINLETAKGMTRGELELELSKRFRYLLEELGMDRVKAASFMTSILNLGVAMQYYFDQDKAK